MVVEHVDDPDRLGVGERDLGGVDLPEIVREGALEALVRLAPPRRLCGDQVVALQRPVDRRYRRRLPPRPCELGVDPARTPARMPFTHGHDLDLELCVDPPRRAARPTRARLQTVDAVVQVTLPVAVVARPRDPASPAHLCHGCAGPLRLQQHGQLELFHRHHLEGHAHLPTRLEGKAEDTISGVSQVPRTSQMYRERSVSDLPGPNTSGARGLLGRPRLWEAATRSSPDHQRQGCGFRPPSHGRARKRAGVREEVRGQDTPPAGRQDANVDYCGRGMYKRHQPEWAVETEPMSSALPGQRLLARAPPLRRGSPRTCRRAWSSRARRGRLRSRRLAAGRRSPEVRR